MDETEICPQCGARLDSGFNYCPECGSALSTESREAGASEPSPESESADSGEEEQYPPSWTTVALYAVPLLMVYIWLISPMPQEDEQGPVNRMAQAEQETGEALSGELNQQQPGTEEDSSEFNTDFLLPPERSEAQLFTDVERFRVRVEQNPEEPEAHKQLGNAYFAWRRVDEAIESYQEFRRLKGGDPVVEARIGALFLARGELEKARGILRDVAENNPSYGEAQIYWAHLLHSAGENQRAVQVLEEFSERHPDNLSSVVSERIAMYTGGGEENSLAE